METDLYGNDESQCNVSIGEVYPGFEGEYQCRTILQSQVNLLDVIVGEIVDKLVNTSLWDNTLVLFSSDNGGHIQLESGAGNNWPFRGGKETDLQGGIRAMALLNGGYLPDDRRGVVLEGYMHTADWYATLCGMLGIEASDPDAVALGLPDIDSLNIWPYMMGEVDESPRFEIIISDTTIIYDAYKLMIGKYPYAVWQSGMLGGMSTHVL